MDNTAEPLGEVFPNSLGELDVRANVDLLGSGVARCIWQDGSGNRLPYRLLPLITQDVIEVLTLRRGCQQSNEPAGL